MSPHGLFVVVVVVVRVVVVVGGRVVVVGARVVVVVVTAVVVVAPLVPPASPVVVVVLVVEVLTDVFALVAAEVPVVVGVVAGDVRRGSALRFTTTTPASPNGWIACGAVPSAPWASSAATAAPIRAPTASRAGPPPAVSIHTDYRPHPIGSNHLAGSIPARHPETPGRCRRRTCPVSTSHAPGRSRRLRRPRAPR
ncbi:hypothetical protein C8E97_0404 [Saccharothrix australiensis]|uniref:Uncharacterized protein n=1 Tax=Saccharothrix australiensis TaxID=2072 RepID=A0A495VRM1_9PSEU|nr:hypothetical protein C8E97_0404 [Saccharothrix australiensis]